MLEAFVNLDKLDKYLTGLGLPSAIVSRNLYRIYPAPRFVISWRGIRITQVYVQLMVNVHENPELFHKLLGELMGKTTEDRDQLVVKVTIDLDTKESRVDQVKLKYKEN